jgi:hypothetical protein
MRDWDIPALFHFIRRPSMYTGSSMENDYKSIDLFLFAYEMGAKGECDFRERLINQLVAKYGVQCPSEGFSKQLELASEKSNQDIKEIFINESLEILIAESDKENRNIFANYCRKQMIEQLEKFPEKINSNWVSNFSPIIRELQAWRGVQLTTEEMSKAEILIEQINELIKAKVTELVSVPVPIRILKDELNEQLKRNVKI